MNEIDEITFNDVSAARLEKYFHHAIEVLMKRRARLEHTTDSHGKKLPKIMINPPSEKVLKAGKKKTITKIVETKEELSDSLRDELELNMKKRHTKLQKKYNHRISLLKGQILTLESDISSVLDELDQYMAGTHPHIAKHISKDDLTAEISALEHKLHHYETKGEKYNELVKRLTNARSRLDALEI